MSDAIQFIVHEQPVLRSESDYIARIALGPFGFEGQFEQVWLRRVRTGEGMLCCVPFRAYGVGLRDTVRISADGSTVVEVVRRSGNRAIRALLTAKSTPKQMRATAAGIEERIVQLGLLSEWSGDRHVAIDVPADADPSMIVGYLDESELAGGLRWEWNDAERFGI
jgi:hypothetical protein